MNELSFLSDEFLPVRVEHYQILTEFLKKHPQPLSGYTMASLAAWSTSYEYEWAFVGSETLFISYSPNPGSQRQLLQPIGRMSPGLKYKIIEEASSLSYSLKFITVSDRFLKENPDLERACIVREERNNSNYLYRTDALAGLRGRKYSKKRNLLSQASNLYKWTCRKVTAERTDDCFGVLNSIHEEEQPLIIGMLAWEIDALRYTLEHFEDLKQQGLLVYIDDTPVAFSIFEEISPDTVAIHFERALRRYKGLYQIINWETAKVIDAQGYEYINREEDLGDAGLRDAKSSYHPIRIVPSYELRFPK